MFKRLHTFYLRYYDRFMLFLTRHAPKTGAHEKEHLDIPWEPGEAHHCPYCIWRWLDWDEERQKWHCSICGLLLYPNIAVTEKRPALLLPPKVVHLDPDTGQPMRLSKAYKRNTLDLGKWVQDRPVWKDTGRPVRTDELTNVRVEDRRKMG